MALIKNIDAMMYDYAAASSSESTDFTAIFTLNNTNTALIEDQDNEILWLNGIPHDRISLVPKFNLSPKAFSFLKKNVLNYFSNNILITKQPSIAISHDGYSSTDYRKNSDINFQKYSSWDSVLNLNTIKPSYLTFQKNNEDYIIYYYQTHVISAGDDGGKQLTKLFVVKTSDYSNYTDYLELDFDVQIIPIHYDVDNDSIICVRMSGTTTTPVTTTILKLTFSPLALASETSLNSLDQTANTTSGTGILSHLNFFVGYDSNNKPTMCSFKHGTTFEMKASLIDYTGANPAFSVVQTPNAQVTPTNQINPVPSIFVQSPVQATPNIYYSYYPTFDSNGNFIPVVIIWDKSQDLSSNQNPFNLGEVPLANITYPANKSSQDYIYPDTFNLINSNIQAYKGNITAYTRCFITKQGANYFLNHVNVFKRKSAYTSMLTQPTSLNLTTYQITNLSSSAGPVTLTFLQSIQVDCMDMVIENQDATELVIISPNSIKFLNFSNLWEITSEYTGIYTNYTKDALGRRWVTKQPLSTYSSEYAAYENYQGGNLKLIDPQIELHLIDDTIPYRTSISFATPNQTYTGSDLANTLNVDAFDENGSRIAVDVFLVIEGNDMTFDSNTATELVVTTSTIQSTAVPVTITGPGHISVAASFHLV